jgi:uncharacterized membrane protein
LYDFWQFLHVVSAIVWVGAAALAVFLSFRLEALHDDPLATAASRLMESNSVPLFMVASMATFVTGLIMAFGWVGFSPLWIKIGLVGVVISLALGFGYFKPQIAALEAAVAERGPNDPDFRNRIRRTNYVALGEMAVFLVVIWAMVAKPA